MRLSLTIAALAAGLIAGAAQAQTASQVQGAVKALSGDELVVTGAAGDVTVTLTPETRIFTMRPISQADLKDGVYVGTTNKDAPEGGHATEVHVADGGPAFQAEWGAPGLMMTNGKVKSVKQTAKGQEFDVDYSAGVRHVVAAPGTPITRVVPADRALLKPGVPVQASVKEADGRKVAVYVSIREAQAAQ